MTKDRTTVAASFGAMVCSTFPSSVPVGSTKNLPRSWQIFFLANRSICKYRDLDVNEVNDSQLEKFRTANWVELRQQLVKYAEWKVRRRRWKSAGSLPKGKEPADLVSSAIAKTLNAILHDASDEGIATWNEDVNPELVDHLKGAIDTEISNLLRSGEHRKMNYSASKTEDEAVEIFESAVDSQSLNYAEDSMPLEFERFEEFTAAVMKQLDGDDEAQLMFMTYQELSKTHDVVKPGAAADKLGISAKESYNLRKKICRAAELVIDRLEADHAK